MLNSQKRMLPWLIHALIFGVSTAAVADEKTTKEKETTKLEKVQVWGTEVSSSSLYLGENDIEIKQADHLSDLLSDIPGVNVGGTHSINNRVNIRGFQDEDLEITLDGAKVQNVNMFHHIGNLLINPDILKKADIQVGNNSVVHSGLGGSVAFETKDGIDLLEPGESLGARVAGNYYTNAEQGGTFSGYGKLGDSADFLLYYRHVNKDNWTDGNGDKTFGADGTVYNALVKLGVDITNNQRLSLSYDTLKDKGDYSPRPDFGHAYNQARTGDHTFPTEYDRRTITLKHELDLGEALYMTTSVYSNENELERFEKLDGTTPVRPPFGIPSGSTNKEGTLNGKVKTQGINLKAQTIVDSGWMAQTFTYGLIYDEQTSKVTWDGHKYGDDERAKTIAVFIEDKFAFDSGFLITPGLRYTNYDFDGAYGKIDDSKVTYGLAGEYEVVDGFSLLASTNSLYKGVEMVDVLATNRIVVPDNEDLKSETGVNNQVGFRYAGQNVMGADSVGIQFTYFQTEINDYIVQEYNKMSNGGTLNLNGFEASFNYKWQRLNALLTYSHSDSKFEETKDPLVKEPGDMLTFGLDYRISPQMSVRWDSTFVSEEKDRPTGDQYNPKKGYNVHDIAFNWAPMSVKGLTLIAGVDNIFDEAYVSHISENRNFTVGGEEVSNADYEPGRNIKVTVSYKF